ncbi:MAG: hypothetical protein QM647_09570 [Asticcacaulis sp.]|uniref:hypothetical protein n=1 Tax=Asticcacaulis sp. TaxID=1872648 RepID=UPI0039E3A05A
MTRPLVGGDVASDIGAHFKTVSSVGYIFADASYVHPGHGLTKSLLKEGCAEPAIVNGLIKLIKETH